jgi:hypothetical protein
MHHDQVEDAGLYSKPLYPLNGLSAIIANEFLVADQRGGNSPESFWHHFAWA